jgi:hypothetical protein
MSAKDKKNKTGPSWVEVGLGAVLSLLLGVVLGATYLVFRPVVKAAARPKDAPASAVYYIEGPRDFDKTLELNEKRKAFDSGQSVSLTEGELNVLLGEDVRPPVPPSGKPGDKPGDKPVDTKTIDPGPLNARLHDAKIQFGNTVSLNVFGVSSQLIVQATGVFAKHGSKFEFEPEVFYVGGCPVQRFLVLRGWLLNKLLFSQPVPEDIAAAWPKLVDVHVDGATLRLKMPQG